MEKEIKTLKIPKCPKCKKQMEVGLTTEKEEGDEGKPRVIICFGTCERCKVRLVFDLIDTKSLPSNLEELMNVLQKKKRTQKERKR